MMANQVLVLHHFSLPWRIAFVDSVISHILLLASCLLVMNTLRYYLPRGKQYVNIFSLCILLTIIWLLISNWLLSITLGYYPGYSYMLHQSSLIRFSIGFLLLGCVAMI